MELTVIDGVKYDPASIPKHVSQLFAAFAQAQKMRAELQAQLLVANHAYDSLAATIRGAMSVIPPYIEPPRAEQEREFTQSDYMTEDQNRENVAD